MVAKRGKGFSGESPVPKGNRRASGRLQEFARPCRSRVPWIGSRASQAPVLWLPGTRAYGGLRRLQRRTRLPKRRPTGGTLRLRGFSRRTFRAEGLLVRNFRVDGLGPGTVRAEGLAGPTFRAEGVPSRTLRGRGRGPGTLWRKAEIDRSERVSVSLEELESPRCERPHDEVSLVDCVMVGNANDIHRTRVVADGSPASLVVEVHVSTVLAPRDATTSVVACLHEVPDLRRNRARAHLRLSVAYVEELGVTGQGLELAVGDLDGAVLSVARRLVAAGAIIDHDATIRPAD